MSSRGLPRAREWPCTASLDALTAKLKQAGLCNEKEFYDFNSMEFQAIRAPY